jgi:glycosyltransferase involved in cell wall biosynthesis
MLPMGARLKTPHILVLPSWYPSPGHPLNGVFFREQAKILHEAGFPVGVVFPDLRRLRTMSPDALRENHFQVSAGREKGLPTVRLNGWNVPSARLRRRLFCQGAKILAGCYARRYGVPDLVHAHSTLWAGVGAVDIAEELGSRVMITEHHSGFIRDQIRSWQVPWIERSLERADRLTAVSAHLQSALKPFASGTDIYVTPNVVDADHFELADRRGHEGFTFLTVSFLNHKKAVDVLIEAFALAFGDSDDVRLTVGGDGPLRNELKELARRRGVGSQIQFLGMLNRREVRNVMGKADGFVLPSLWETFGVVLIEAMATGLPVLATRCGGPEELVGEETGILVEPGDVHDLAAGLRELRRTASSYTPEAIRERTVNRYGKRAFVRRMSAHYSAAMTEHSSMGGADAR